METLPYKIEALRKLCIKKDIIELSYWIDSLSMVNSELDHLSVVEKQLLKSRTIEVNLQGLRRKNALVMATLCKYEQLLRTEYEYGQREYDIIRAKEHEKKRDSHSSVLHEFNNLKRTIYLNLAKYHR